ncbi:MAG: glycosyltransferase [Acidobacteriota bacterium]|nr:glycosyltransferase [Acidobacteriota bacterium]
MMQALEIVFWVASALIVWTQAGYAFALRLVVALRRSAAPAPAGGAEAEAGEAPPPVVSLIIAAHNEQEVIGAKVANALRLLHPRDRLEIIVSCDGCTDETAQRARDAGADLVLELPRGGKIRAQDQAVARSRGEIVAFSDANSAWDTYALRALLRAFSDPQVAYACGQVHYLPGEGDSQEGFYWRYELALRALESRLASITGGNGAIYATRREDYLVVDPIMGHDLSFPFNLVKRGRRAVYVPEAVASEKMVPSIDGEFARKRRMMGHTWPIVLRGGMLSPRGYPPAYLLMILSHRALRYATPLLHLVALAANAIVVAEGAGIVLRIALWAQGAVIAASVLGDFIPLRPLLMARHYVLTTAAVALGLWDWLRHGTSAQWQAAEGTR